VRDADLLLDENFLNSYTRDDEVGIRLCDMIPNHVDCSCVVWV
jgi:hypothetical protein